MRALLDASPIVAFCEEMDSPDTLLLLRNLGFDLEVPNAVREEIIREPSTSLLQQYSDLGEMRILPPVDSQKLAEFRTSHPAFGDGEGEVIINALEIGMTEGDLCILDEGPARRLAEFLGLPTTGTIGVLNRLRDASLITETEDRLLRRRLAASSFRVNKDFLER